MHNTKTCKHTTTVFRKLKLFKKKSKTSRFNEKIQEKTVSLKNRFYIHTSSLA